MAVKTFTQAEKLTAADTNTYLTNGGLVWVATATAPGTSRALLLDNIFTSTFTSYRCVVRLRSTVNTNALFFQYLDTSGNSVTSGYFGTAYSQDFTAGGTGFTPAALNISSAQYVGYIPNSSSHYLNAVLDIYAPNVAADATAINGQFVGISSGAAYAGGQVLGMMSVAAAYRGLRFDNGGAGNLTGSISVYGYRIS